MRTLLAFVLCLCACSDDEATPRPGDADSESDNPVSAALAPVRARERELRTQPQPAWSSVSGADPTLVLPWADEGFVGLLRGPGAVVRLGPQGEERERLAVVDGAVGWDRDGETLHIVGERSNEVVVVRDVDGKFVVQQRVPVEGVQALRAVVVRPEGGWVVADRHRGQILTVSPEGSTGEPIRCEGAIDVQRHGSWIIANCLLEHAVRVFALEPSSSSELRTVAQVQHDGPIWAVAPRTVAGALELGLAGVEDHPLDRSAGGFGYVDSFVFHVRLEDGVLRRLAAVNVGAHGVVTPKHLAWHEDTLWVTGAGADSMAAVRVGGDEPAVETWTVPAGLTAFSMRGAEVLAADPLLDQWVHLDAQRHATGLPVGPHDPRTEAVRLGEALVFTTLMAPQASSDGPGSRFTCETCHFEGTVDGRVHFTGRGEVYATTKTLRGLVGNQPHFSRALDRTTTGMIHNEFRVANANTPQDPWFALETAEFPWLATLTQAPRYDPAQLRAAVLEFLAAFTPEPNPAAQGRSAFTPLERRGASRFEALCEACHQARTVADDPGSRVSAAAWESDIFGGGTLLWASEDRYRTGVQPYVHEDGARVPSLRRLWVKRPYLTQGGASDVQDVLAAVRVGTDGVHGGEGGESLSSEDQDVLAAFLDLL
ncbi:MAG: hypothetical protein ACRBN8_38240 [Nannocystales bacterium]